MRFAKLVEREVVLGGFDMATIEEHGVKGQDQEQMPAEVTEGNENVPGEGTAKRDEGKKRTAWRALSSDLMSLRKRSSCWLRIRIMGNVSRN